MQRAPEPLEASKPRCSRAMCCPGRRREAPPPRAVAQRRACLLTSGSSPRRVCSSTGLSLPHALLQVLLTPPLMAHWRGRFCRRALSFNCVVVLGPRAAWKHARLGASPLGEAVATAKAAVQSTPCLLARRRNATPTLPPFLKDSLCFGGRTWPLSLAAMLLTHLHHTLITQPSGQTDIWKAALAASKLPA